VINALPRILWRLSPHFSITCSSSPRLGHQSLSYLLKRTLLSGKRRFGLGSFGSTAVHWEGTAGFVW
jgi:hypothetical protein